MDRKTVNKLERDLEKAIAEVVIVRNKKLEVSAASLATYITDDGQGSGSSL